jgi:hypothetical protein
MTQRSLDSGLQAGQFNWLCIGAQKAGTSTLFRLLQGHPELYIPPSKEDPVFDRPVTATQVADFVRDRFGSIREGIKCGTVTPHYMISPDIANRVHSYMPDARIIAILRDPVERAFSHYRMNVRKALETRPFHTVVRSQIGELEAGHRPDSHDDPATYVWRSCYGTILRPWFDIYRRSQVLVVFTEELATNQAGVLEDVYRHLGVDIASASEHRLSSNAAPPMHKLSSFRELFARSLRRAGVLDRIPTDRRLRYAERLAEFERRLARVVPVNVPSVDDATLTLLRSFFVSENEQLRALLGRLPPWS